MARIRTIKPEFFTSEDIVALSPLARLLYIALWCEADREGRLNWRPRTLKMKYLPAESCDVMAICDELVSANLVVPYSVDDKPYAVLPSFKKHQAVNMREAQSGLPAPPDEVHVHARAKDAWTVDADTRATVLARDAHKCVRCGSDDHLQIDHIFPKSMGGTNAITNLRVLCRRCNAGRPVSGQGLIDDLAKDGLTLNDMKRTCMHVQGDGEGKGREGKGKERNISPDGEIARARATRLPPGWVLPDDWRCWAAAERPDLDLDRTAAVFADHWRSAAGQRGVKADWLATWRNWVRNERTSPRAAGPPTSRGAESFREREARMAAERVAQFAPAAADRSAMGPRSSAAVLDVEAREIGNVVAIGSR